ncbi:hypothetical protein [Allokutzneria albata]|uniref:Uncharacterized protein n=1 Tax=Allokutzneria albata TaxID=211114 RepID=A0A1G9YB66_ALLAB|nr:hypothetical protein [Allokutzneria albata]SDN05653.1 hypothetical protein SAMN04489726_4678 [Allokutzneria albata]
MSTTNRTTNTDSSVHLLQPVTDPNYVARTDSEDKLWKALHTNPNSTTNALAHTAEIGKSTAAKILARWDKERCVTRTPGIAEGGRRAADLWAITETDAPDSPRGSSSANDTAVEEAVPVAPVQTMAPEMCAEDSSGSSANSPIALVPMPSCENTWRQSDATTVASSEPGATEDTVPVSSDDCDDSGPLPDGETKLQRLAPGTLRGMVEDYLRDHPGEEFGPTAIAKDLGGKSSGAVSNALDKLVIDGTAVKTNDNPRRFTLAPAKQGAASGIVK